MPEPRTSQDLFNKIADIIDFQPHKYNQGVWGHAGTKYIGVDPDYVMWDDSSYEHDELYVDEKDLNEATRVDDACGTQACVAGWACLLSGFHPTMVEVELEEDSDRWAGSIMDRVSSMFSDAQAQLRRGGLMSLFSRKLGYNYNVMSDKENVDLPIDPNTGRLLQMEDLEEGGREIGGNMFYRPDMAARLLLDLEPFESSVLFDGDYTWEANDLRMIGKGEDPAEMLDMDQSYCEDCDEYGCVCE